MRAARSLPMPGISRSPASSSDARSCGWFDAMSAPLRYSRILNGLSSLISSRSAISRRMRAMAELSIACHPQPLAFDREVEQPGAALSEGPGDGRARFRRSVAEEASAAAGAADLRRGRAGFPGASDEIVDRRSRHAGRETLAIFPLRGDLAAHLVEVAPLERDAHRDRCVANALERIVDLPIAVDVTLRDVPVVGSRVARCPGIRQHDSPFELARVDGNGRPLDAVHAQLDRKS